MKKTVHLLLAVFAVAGFGMAQNAETVMNVAAVAYEKSNGISAQFAVNTQSEKQGFSESFEGTIQMKGDKFAVITPEIRMWYDGTTQWTYMVATGEVNLTTPAGDELLFVHPMTLLCTYQKEFNVTYTGESTADTGRMAHDIQLAAKGNSDVEKIDVQIEKITSLPVRMTVFMKNGMRNLIRIRNLQTGVNQPDSFFIFNPKDYPGVVEIDLR